MSNFKGKILPFIGVLMGLFFVVAYFWGDYFLASIPSENELTEVSGEIEWVKRASKKGRDVCFKVKGQGTYVYNGYGGSLAKEIFESLSKQGVQVKVLADLSETQKPWFHEFSYNPVYEIVVNKVVIRSYGDSIASENRVTNIFPWFGLFLIMASIYEYHKYRKQVWFKT